MGKTPIYGLGYLEPNQDLSENLDLDELRFRAIDTQTYSLYQIFGNGIIEDETNNYASWVISVIPNDFQNIRISSGKGFVSWKSAETTSFVDVALPILPTGVTSVTVWAYAVANDNTPITKEVDFITSLFQINDPDNYISLGGVVVTFGANTSIVPFTTGRARISLFASLSNIINQHKHIGGSNNPSPINLGSHVQGKLSGEYIENLDISTVTKGTLDAERLPTIDHKNLTNIGTLSHSQIDSLLGALTLPDSSYRLSDLSMANRLQIVLAMKKQFAADSDSTQINALFYIPAIYPNRSTDTALTFRDLDLPAYVGEANVYDTVGAGYDPAVNFIEAAESDSNTAFSVTYDTKTQFQTMYDYITGKDLGLYADENVKINGTSADSIDGNFTIDTPLNFTILSNAAGPDFENAAFGWNYFTKKLRNTDDTYTDTQYTVYTIPTAKRDWSDKTHIGFGINLAETDSACSIYMTLLVDTADNRIKDTTLVSETIEDRANSTVQTLEIKRSIFKKIYINGTDDYDTDIFVNVDLSELIALPSNRVNIVGFAFYVTTNDSAGEKWDGNASPELTLVAPSTELIVDINGDELTNVIAERQNQENGYLSAMFLWNEYLYAANARYIFRLNTGSSSATLNLYAYEITVPSNTSYTISARITDSSTEDDLNSKTALDITAEATLIGSVYEITPPSSYTISVPGAGDVTESKFNIGRYVDIIIDLYSDFEGISTPEFQKLNIVYTSVGGTQSRIWNKDNDDFSTGQSGWYESEYQKYNIAIGATYSEGGFDKNSLLLDNVSDIGNWIYMQKNAVVSANQTGTTSTFEDGQDNSTAEFNLKFYLTPWQIFNKSTTYGFYKPKDFRIMWDNTSVYADTANDRIVHFESDGKVKRIIQGNLRLKKSERDFMLLAVHYNPDTGIIYLPFSQCVNIVDTTSIKIVYDGFDISANETQYVSSVELLTPLVSQKSSTVLIKLTTQFNKILKAAATKKVIVLTGAFTSNGQADNASETSNNTNNIGGSGSNTGNSILTPPSGAGSGDSSGDGSGGFVVQSVSSNESRLLKSPSLKYFDLRNRINFNGSVEISGSVNLSSTEGSFTKMDFKAFADGDITEIFDYNGDGISTTLIGPPMTGLTTAQSGVIDLPMIQGPIYYANIYNPISINMTNSYQYVIAQPYANSVVCFDSDTANTLLWSISSSLISYTEGLLGSAYVLNNNNVLCAVPSKSSTEKGKVIIIKRTNAKDFPITTLPQDGDCVYALPSEKSGEYYVIVDDTYTNGTKSKLLRVNSSNKVIKSWNNNNLLTHPKGLAVLQNGDLLVSE